MHVLNLNVLKDIRLVSMCLKDIKITPTSNVKTFIRFYQDFSQGNTLICNFLYFAKSLIWGLWN